jgi:DNA-binding LacI/PurR family transcriptional regulator
MTDINDVARAAGVSTATVSRALRGLPNVSPSTVARVRQAAESLNYVVSSSASGLASGRTGAIGVVVSTLTRWFNAAVVEGADGALRSAGYDVVLFNLGGPAGDRERDFHRSILRRRTDALLTIGVTFSSEERRQLVSTGHPTISIGTAVRGFPHVSIDDEQTARAATQYLIGLGHREIAHLGGSSGGSAAEKAKAKRRNGYLKALSEAGIASQSEWDIPCQVSAESARLALFERLGAVETMPTAVFAETDEIAIGAMIGLTQQGLRIPEDVSVVGIDDEDWSEAFGLTTFAQDPRDLGRSAATLLVDELSGGRTLRRSVHKVAQLVERTSAGPPPRVPLARL